MSLVTAYGRTSPIACARKSALGQRVVAKLVQSTWTAWGAQLWRHQGLWHVNDVPKYFNQGGRAQWQRLPQKTRLVTTSSSEDVPTGHVFLRRRGHVFWGRRGHQARLLRKTWSLGTSSSIEVLWHIVRHVESFFNLQERRKAKIKKRSFSGSTRKWSKNNCFFRSFLEIEFLPV